MPTKGLSSLLLSPLRWTDRLATDAGHTNRISAGFYVIAKKPNA
jgi:hypothetical protein